MRRVGVLMAVPENGADSQARVAVLQQGLEKLGWTVGRNLHIEYRWGMFDVERAREVTLVGFWSSQHQGIFTPMGTNMHAHFQTRDNKVSGHVQDLKLAQGLKLALPKG
jgi:hypothetical protein